MIRIVHEVRPGWSNENTYFLQKRFLWFFWRDVKFYDGFSGNNRRLERNTPESLLTSYESHMRYEHPERKIIKLTIKD